MSLDKEMETGQQKLPLTARAVGIPRFPSLHSLWVNISNNGQKMRFCSRMVNKACGLPCVEFKMPGINPREKIA